MDKSVCLWGRGGGAPIHSNQSYSVCYDTMEGSLMMEASFMMKGPFMMEGGAE